MTPISKFDLIETLKELAELSIEGGDPKQAHIDADAALLEYINDPEVTRSFDEIAKWYA